MKAFSNTLYVRMQQEIQEVSDKESGMELAQRCVEIAANKMQELKDYIQSFEFKNPEDEIEFFKAIKPRFHRELIYWKERIYLEMERPIADRKSVSVFYTSALSVIQQYFDRNKLLYTYYRLGKTRDMDFSLKSHSEHLVFVTEYQHDLDIKFSNILSFKYSKIQAYEMLAEYITSEIEKLQFESRGISKADFDKSGLEWTDSKAALIELLYSLWAYGSFNHGKIELVQIVRTAEAMFGVQLGNFYRVIQGLRIRKKDRTAFLSSLSSATIKKMDETDMLMR